VFRDRRDAGRQLARLLTSYANRSDLVVLALPRGGVPVAAEVAAALHAPFDVFLVRKLGVPFHEELAMGAVAEGGVRVLNQELIHELGIRESEIEKVSTGELVELDRRARAFRGTRPAPAMDGRVIILIDDGLATGSTMEAAVMAVRSRHPAKVIVAVPVAARETVERIRQIADEVLCVATPDPFQAVGLWYDDFTQMTDAEVVAILPAG
jgi:putative phosphoribosyl transferase